MSTLSVRSYFDHTAWTVRAGCTGWVTSGER